MEKLQFLNDINVRDEINLYAHDIKLLWLYQNMTIAITCLKVKNLNNFYGLYTSITAIFCVAEIFLNLENIKV